MPIHKQLEFRYLKGSVPQAQARVSPWFGRALKYYGLSDGILQDDFAIERFLSTVGLSLISVDEDSGATSITDWCSAFVNTCVTEAGFKGTNRGNARSWLQWGRSVRPPQLGDIVTLWRYHNRDTVSFGHVGFFVKFFYDRSPRPGTRYVNHAPLPVPKVVVLGGNQGRYPSVNFGAFPISAGEHCTADSPFGVLDYRTMRH